MFFRENLKTKEMGSIEYYTIETPMYVFSCFDPKDYLIQDPRWIYA